MVLLRRGMRERRGRLPALLGALLAVGLAGPAAAGPPAAGQPAPDVAGAPWVNSPPLTMAALRGRVVLIDFWTYG